MFRTPVRCHVEHGWVRARCDSEAILASRGRNMVRIAPSMDWATCRGKAVARATGRVAGTDIDVRIKLAFLYSTLRVRLSTSVVRPTEVHGVSREVHHCRRAAAPEQATDGDWSPPGARAPNPAPARPPRRAPGARESSARALRSAPVQSAHATAAGWLAARCASCALRRVVPGCCQRSI